MRKRLIIVGAVLSVAGAIALANILSHPTHGTLETTATGFRYTPDPGFVGQDKFFTRQENDALPTVVNITNRTVQVFGHIDDVNGNPIDLSIVKFEVRGDRRGNPYNVDLLLGSDGLVAWVIPIPPTLPEDIEGYPPAIIEGHPGGK